LKKNNLCKNMLKLKSLAELDVRGKRVLLRCDFNIPLDAGGNIQDDFRINQTLPTIEYLIKHQAKVVLMSHLGDPEGKRVESLSLVPVQKKLSEYLGLQIKKTEDCIGREAEKEVAKLQDGGILLLENLRFYKEEEANDPEFVRELAKLGDVYVNDAFGVCHRKHASIFGLAQALPAAAGLLLEKEVKVLSRVLEDPWRPLCAVIGGAKISTKIKVIKQFLEKADNVLIGGKIAEPILIVKKICIGRSWPEEEVAREIEKLDLTSTRLHLPIDAAISPDPSGNLYIRQAAPGKTRKDELLLDIGDETISFFSQIIKDAKMIIWAGPMGYFENPAFEKGTKEIAEAIARNINAYKIVGGGDTLFAVSKFGLIDKFDHVSTGGGAMLVFLGGEALPGLQVLEKK